MWLFQFVSEVLPVVQHNEPLLLFMYDAPVSYYLTKLNKIRVRTAGPLERPHQQVDPQVEHSHFYHFLSRCCGVTGMTLPRVLFSSLALFSAARSVRRLNRPQKAAERTLSSESSFHWKQRWNVKFPSHLFFLWEAEEKLCRSDKTFHLNYLSKILLLAVKREHFQKQSTENPKYTKYIKKASSKSTMNTTSHL